MGDLWPVATSERLLPFSDSFLFRRKICLIQHDKESQDNGREMIQRSEGHPERIEGSVSSPKGHWLSGCPFQDNEDPVIATTKRSTLKISRPAPAVFHRVCGDSRPWLVPPKTVFQCEKF